MAEWLFEDGIGERRAAWVDHGRIVECLVERDEDGIVAGAIAKARVVSREASGMHLVQLECGEEALLSRLPPHTSMGAEITVEIVRSAIIERDLVKRAKCRPASADAVSRRAATLLERIRATGANIRMLHTHEDDALEDAGWSEWMDVAASGIMSFAGGILRMALTPAMVVIDVDGSLNAPELARAGAAAAARMIRALGIGGNIIIDLPTQDNKAHRISAAQSFDAAMPLSFERTAVNGYGLLQIIRPRSGPSLAERWQYSPVESAALALLRRAERHSAHRVGTEITLCANPAEVGWIGTRPHLLATLGERSAKRVTLQADASLGMGYGHAV